MAALANLSSNGLLVSIAVLVSAVAGFTMIVVFIKLRKNIGVFEYLAVRKPRVRTILAVLGIALGLLLVVTYFESLLGQSTANNSNFTSDAYRTAVYPALLWIAVVIFAPVFEESFFRGFLFAGLIKSRLGAVGTILITAVVFGILHFQYNWAGMLEVFILGIVLGTVRLKSGSIFASIAVHSFWNFIATLLTALSFYGILH
jgi:membrane protease YdiL (CAAX protease family)